MEENTLGIKEMKIVKTKEFLERYTGVPLVFWVGREPFYFSIDYLSKTMLVPLKTKKVVVFFGSNDKIKFGADINHGFGFRRVGDDESIWVDKMNEEEMAVIIYDQKKDREDEDGITEVGESP